MYLRLIVTPERMRKFETFSAKLTLMPVSSAEIQNNVALICSISKFSRLEYAEANFRIEPEVING